jgi:endonuclease YncB( thermonuclease family)
MPFWLRTLAVLVAVVTIDGSPALSWPRSRSWARPPTVWAARQAHADSRLRRPFVVQPGAIRVHDGDTFYIGPDTIRLRGIDTPELGEPKSWEARRRLAELLRQGPVTVIPRALDVYGRTVAIVLVRGQDVAVILRREGFAKPVVEPPRGRRPPAHVNR